MAAKDDALNKTQDLIFESTAERCFQKLNLEF